MIEDGTEGRSMATAIFHRDFHWSRPKSKFGFFAKASPEPQSRVHDFVQAAVAAGAATRVKLSREKAPRRRK